MPSKYDDKNYSFDIKDDSSGIRVDVFQKTKGRELLYLRTINSVKTIDDAVKAMDLIKSTVPPISR